MFPEVGGAAGKGKMPRAALSDGTTCTNLCSSFPLPEPHRLRKRLFLSTSPSWSSLPMASQPLPWGKPGDDPMPSLTPARLVSVYYPRALSVPALSIRSPKSLPCHPVSLALDHDFKLTHGAGLQGGGGKGGRGRPSLKFCAGGGQQLEFQQLYQAVTGKDYSSQHAKGARSAKTTSPIIPCRLPSYTC